MKPSHHKNSIVRLKKILGLWVINSLTICMAHHTRRCISNSVRHHARADRMKGVKGSPWRLRRQTALTPSLLFH